MIEGTKIVKRNSCRAEAIDEKKSMVHAQKWILQEKHFPFLL